MQSKRRYKEMKRFLSLLVAIAMLLTMSAALADMTADEYAAAAKVFPTSFEGKTVILHSNDVHGAIMGYAYMAELRNEMEAKGAASAQPTNWRTDASSMYLTGNESLTPKLLGIFFKTIDYICIRIISNQTHCTMHMGNRQIK